MLVYRLTKHICTKHLSPLRINCHRRNPFDRRDNCSPSEDGFALTRDIISYLVVKINRYRELIISNSIVSYNVPTVHLNFSHRKKIIFADFLYRTQIVFCNVELSEERFEIYCLNIFLIF